MKELEQYNHQDKISSHLLIINPSEFLMLPLFLLGICKVYIGKEKKVKGLNFNSLVLALAGLAQWIEHWPENQKVAGSIPSQGTCLRCEPGPQ